MDERVELLIRMAAEKARERAAQLVAEKGLVAPAPKPSKYEPQSTPE